MNKYLENASLLPFNTFHININSKYLTTANTVDEFNELIFDEKFKTTPKLILGGGSNVLFTKDFNGLTILNRIKGISIVEENNTHLLIKSGSGEVWHDLVQWCVNNNYGGIENLSLIPGSVGAGPMQNIGAYGVELKDVFYKLEAMQINTGEIKTFGLDECNFGYRSSVFKTDLKGEFIITSVTLKLNKNPSTFSISYGAIEKELQSMKIEQLTVRNISNAVINIRKSKLPDPAEIGNAGSFFKNPEITSSQFEILKNIFPDIVGYPTLPGQIKLAAGWLIEQCGWKGKVIGNTGSHKNQALVLVNYGNASGAEVLQLANEIQQSVKSKFEVELEMEVNII